VTGCFTDSAAYCTNACGGRGGGRPYIVVIFVGTEFSYERSTGGLLMHGKQMMITDNYISEHR
jgi:hypothetical protein